MDNVSGSLLRVSILYLFALAVVRASGKRTISAIAPMDLVIVFAIGDMFDDVIFAGVSVASGFTAIGSTALLHVVNSYLGIKSKAYDRVIGGNPVLLVEKGRLRRDGMAKERIGERTLWSLLRLRKVEKLAEVKKALLEPSGGLSVIRTEEARDAQKCDREKLPGMTR